MGVCMCTSSGKQRKIKMLAVCCPVSGFRDFTGKFFDFKEKPKKKPV
jgi:hypothetical protein